MRFVIHAIDRPNSLELRNEIRPAHLEYVADFDTPVGGPLLDQNGDMCGSMVVLEAADSVAAAEFVANDPYRRAGLFERVDIHEFRSVVWPDASTSAD